MARYPTVAARWAASAGMRSPSLKMVWVCRSIMDDLLKLQKVKEVEKIRTYSGQKRAARTV
jgi:hypothetical protein